MNMAASAAQSALGRLAGLSPKAVCETLIPVLDALVNSPPPGEIYLPTLEQIRQPLHDNLKQLRDTFGDRPIPMAEEDERNFQLAITACRRMVNAYQQLVQSLAQSSQEPWYPFRMAVLLHRILHYTSELAVSHYFARRELPAGLWVEMHRAFAIAESLGVETNRVDDALEPHRQASSCVAAYVAAQLLALASPYSLNLRSLRLVTGWASLWAPLVSIEGQAGGSQMPPMAINLATDQGLIPLQGKVQPTPFFRFMDTSRLELEIRKTLQKLREKTPPGRLGLGEDAPTYIIRLAGRIARPWAQLVLLRRHRRLPAQGNLYVVTGFEAIHFHVTGKEFSRPDSSSVYARDVYESKMSHWHQVETIHSRLPSSARVAFFPDTCKLVDASSQGYRALRALEGQRLNQGQLVAVRQDEDSPWDIGIIHNIAQEYRGEIALGIGILGRKPEGVAFARLPDDNLTSLQFTQAFLLPESTEGDEPGSLIVPSGAFYPGRRFEVRYRKAHQQGTLQILLEKGHDFERVTFSLD